VPNTRRLSDANLVRRSQQGDRRAFGALLGRYDRRLRGLAHVLLLDITDMDTALGVAYLRAWRDVVRITPKDDIGAWLYRATYNACIDQLRRDGRPAPRRHRGVRRGLAELAPLDRVAAVLVDREEFSPGAAARILGMTPAVLEERLAVARAALAGYLPGPAVAPEPAPPAAAPTAPAGANGARGNGAKASDNGNGSAPEGATPADAAAAAAGVGPGSGESAAAPADSGSAAPEASSAGGRPPGEPAAAGPAAAEAAPREAAPTDSAAPEHPPAPEPTVALPPSDNGSGSSRRRSRRRRRGGKHAPGQAALAAAGQTPAPDPAPDPAPLVGPPPPATRDSADGPAEDRDPTAETPVPGSPS
jgi:DNA-directed RNA polymerase specialized sigma24 family protein